MWLLNSRTGQSVLFALACAFAYHDLFFFDPSLDAPTEIEPVEEWFFSPTGSSPILIFALTAWFTLRRSARLESGWASGWASGSGGIGICGAMGLVLWSHYVTAVQILPLSLSILLVSVGLFISGASGGRRLLMPATFVAILGTPLPPSLLNAIIYPMQLWTAEVSVAIVRAFGVAVQQSGDLIIAPWATFQVIETCAGLRSTQTMVMAAFVYGELLGLKSRRRLVLIGIAPFIGLLVNFVRVVLLVFTARADDQPDHSIQGILMVVVGVILLWGIDEALDRIGSKPTGGSSPSTSERSPRVPLQPRRVGIVVTALVATGIALQVVQPWPSAPLEERSVHSIPRQLGDWTTGQQTLPVDGEYLGSVRFSNRTSRLYQKQDDVVMLFAGMNDRLRRNGGLVSDKTKILDRGFYLVEQSIDASTESASTTNEAVVRAALGQELLVHHWYENIEPLWIESLRSAFGLDRGPWRRLESSRVYRIATPVEGGGQGRDGARKRLREFEGLIRDEMRDGNVAN